MSDSNLEFSVRNVPDTWNAAASEAPQGTPGPITDKRRTARKMPTGTRPDLMTGTLTGIAMAIITGGAWYTNSINAVFTASWVTFLFAAVTGALIAVAVRLGAGPAGPEMRVGVGALLYVVTILSVTFFVARERIVTLQRRSPGFGEVEDLMTSLYFTDIATIAAWIVGLGIMAQLTFAMRHRRSGSSSGL